MIRSKKIAIIAIVIMLLTLIPGALLAATADSTRLSGDNRIETALAISNAGWTTAGTVVLAPANDANLVDALAAAPLAGQENAPILLTNAASLDAAVKAKIAALGATKVFVVGAVSEAVAAEVDAISGVAVEVLKGANRQATAAAVNAKLTAPAGTFVVGFNAVPDALSVASFAAKNKYAIVLANADGSVGSTLVGATKYIIGGPTLVDDIAGVERIFGADRFATNAAVAAKLGFSFDRVYVANGISLVDALSVAPLAAKYGAFVALASGNDVAAAGVVNAKLTASSKVIAVGGAAVVSAGVVGKVGFVAPATLAVQSVSAINLNQIQIKFTQAVNEGVAETKANYLIDGGALAAGDKVFLSADKLIATIVLDTNIPQGAKRIITVNNIWSDNLINKIAKIETQVTFSDVTTPTVKSVMVDGMRTIKVEFSEAVRMTAAPSFKINGQSVTNYGYTSTMYPTADAGAAGDDRTTTNQYGTKMNINFGTNLPVGTHTLEVPAGAGTNLVDGALFYVAKTEVSFTVVANTERPQVTGVTGQNNGQVFVTWNKKMGASAVNVANYRIVGNPAVPAASFKSGSGDTIVELNFGSGVVIEGANLLEINKDVADIFGNKFNATDNQRFSLTATKDTSAPTVESVIRTADDKIRIKFSEDVDFNFAQTASNYKLKDSSNQDVAVNTILAVPTPGASSDVYEMTTAGKLTGSSYTLEIKNIRDLAATPNTMVTATFTVTGNDNVAPVLLAGVRVSATKAAIFFNETINGTSLTNKSNYAYIDGSGVVRALPGAATVTAKENDKAVEITFPSSYAVFAAAGGGAGEYVVNNIRVANVTDLAGNILDGIAVNTAVAGTLQGIVALNNLQAPGLNAALTTAVGAKLVKDSIVIEEPTSTTIRITAELNKPLEVFAPADFTFAGEAPVSGYLVGSKVVLNFDSTKNLAAIRALGNGAGALLVSAASASTSFAGIQYNGATFAAPDGRVYDDQVKPRIVSIVINDLADTIAITFSENIDPNFAGNYTNDFTFAKAGTVFTNSAPTIAGAVVTYTFTGLIVASDVINVKANTASLDISDIEDRAKSKNVYDPTTALKNGVDVTEGTVYTP